METELRKSCGNCIYFSPSHKEHERCKKCNNFRNNFYPRDARCPVPSCGAGMIYYAKESYLECPDCGTLVQPFFMEKSEKSIIRQEFEKHLECARDKRVGETTIHTKSQVKSGSKSKKARNKLILQKPSQSQIYNKLSTEPNLNYNKELARKSNKDVAK